MSLVGRGRGKGALKTLSSPGAKEPLGTCGGDRVMRARITEVLDVVTFWAQIGTTASLSEFDQLLYSLNTWCEEQGAGSRALPKVKEVIAMRDSGTQRWVRGRVTRQISDSELEVFYIDTGSSGRVKLSDVCSTSSKLLFSFPAQALQCTTVGVEPLDGEEGWSEKVVSRFSELLRGSSEVNVEVHNVDKTNGCSVSPLIMHAGSWTSVGEILAREHLVKYNQLEAIYGYSSSGRQQQSPCHTQPPSLTHSSLQEARPIIETGLEEGSTSDSTNESSSISHPHPPTNGTSKIPLVPLAPVPTPVPLEKLQPPVSPLPHPRPEGIKNIGVHGRGSVGDDSVGSSDSATGRQDVKRQELPWQQNNVVSSRKIKAAVEKERHISSATSGDDPEPQQPELKKNSAIPLVAAETQQGGRKTAAMGDKGKSLSSWGAGLDSPSSDEEWDESLLPPTRQRFFSDSSEGTPQDSPLKNNPFISDPSADSEKERRRQKLEAQFEALVLADTGKKSNPGQPRDYQKKRPFVHKNTGRGQRSDRDFPRDRDRNCYGRPGGMKGVRLLRPQDRGGHHQYHGEERGRPQDRGGHGGHGEDRGRGGNHGDERGQPQDRGSHGEERGRGGHYREERGYVDREKEYRGSERFPTPPSGGRGGGRRFGGDDRQGTQRFYGRQQSDPSFKNTSQQPTDQVYSRQQSNPSLEPSYSQPQEPVELNLPKILGGMTEDETKNEVQWHSWKLKQKLKKILEALSSSNVGNFGAEVQSLLTDTPAQKLMSLPGSKGPLYAILESTISAAVSKPADVDVIVSAITSLQSTVGKDVCQLLQPLLEEVARDICQGSAATDATKNRHAFCLFLGKLFISANLYSGNKDYATTLGLVVRHYLNMWSLCAPGEQRMESVAHADCFAALCEAIGPTIDVNNRETLDAYFHGAIKEHILAAKLSRPVRERLFEVSMNRAGHWGGQVASSRDLQGHHTSSRPQQLQPSASQTQKVPTFSQDVPASENVMHPIPISVGPGPHSSPGYQNGMQPGGMGIGQQQYQVQPVVQHQPIQPPPPSAIVQHQPIQPPPPSAVVQQQPPPPSAFVTPLSPPAAAAPPLSNTPQYQSPQAPMTSPSLHYPPHFQEEQNPYREVEDMLRVLGLSEMLEKCKSSMIKDSVLDFSKDEVKAGLKEAGLPVGAVMAIMDYLEKRQQRKKSSSSSLPSTPIQHPSTPLSPLQPFYAPVPPPLAPQYSQVVGSVPSYMNTSQATPSTHTPPQYQYSTVPSSPGQSGFTERLPASAMSSSSSSVTSNQSPERRGGFGTINCIICGSQNHKTEVCSRRDKFFLH